MSPEGWLVQGAQRDPSESASIGRCMILPVQGLGAREALGLLWIPLPGGRVHCFFATLTGFLRKPNPQAKVNAGWAQPSPAQVRRFTSSQEGGLGRGGERLSPCGEEPWDPECWSGLAVGRGRLLGLQRPGGRGG